MLRVIRLICIVTSVSGLKENQYECGTHGRFEYCIDGIPGCVVGCHCHPGYYFDTDTKICEPNIKLTQYFRRIYPMEPTRITISSITTPNPMNPSYTSINIQDHKADAIITKDIGNWLFKQFFKTIENQILNKTNGSMTRRSDNGIPEIIPKRKSGKFDKTFTKKKRKSKKDLKRKLLRITEDGILFDSNSDEYRSSSSHSDISLFEIENYDEQEHRKLTMINKKTSPPLPSLIFLPNIDISFYPPIGIPPPPIISMYPMVQVPPMVSIVYPGTTKYNEKVEKTTIMQTTSSSKTTKGKVTEHTTISTEKNTTPSKHTDITESSLYIGPEITSITPIARSKSQKPIQQNELLRNIREKTKNINKVPMFNRFRDQNRKPGLQLINNMTFIQKPLSYYERNYRSDNLSNHQNVNFKYLTQIIHRIHLNKTKEIHNPMPNYKRSNLNTYITPITEAIPLKMEHRRNLPKTDKSYYENLGREIASLIKKVDSKGEKKINQEIEQENRNTQKQPVFNENYYIPQSYWERSFRSLLINPKVDESEYFGDTDEHLYNLENDVVAVTTTSTLTLQGLENVVSVMEKAQSKLQDKNYQAVTNTTEKITSHNNLNINLYSKGNKRSNVVYNNTKFNTNNLNRTQTISRIFRHTLINKPNIKDGSIRLNIRNESKKLLIGLEGANNNKFKKQHNHQLPIYNYVSNVIYFPERRANFRKHIDSYSLAPMILDHKHFNFHTTNARFGHKRNLTNYSKQIIIYGKPSKLSYFNHELNHFDYFH